MLPTMFVIAGRCVAAAVPPRVDMLYGSITLPKTEILRALRAAAAGALLRVYIRLQLPDGAAP